MTTSYLAVLTPIIDMTHTLLSQWSTWVGEAHMILAIALFFITNWIGKHSFSLGYVQIELFVKDDASPAFNYIIRVFTPIVFLVITSALLYQFKLDRFVAEFFMISVYYVLFRIFINFAQERMSLINWPKQILYYVSILFLSWLVYDKIISVKANVLPDPSNIVNEMWVIIILYLYSLVNNLSLPAASAERRRDKYLERRIADFKALYGSVIDRELSNDILKAVAYAILVHENFNRSTVVRWLENVNFILTKKPHSLGIMQYPTRFFINDRQSVMLGARKIRKTYKKIRAEFKPYASDSNGTTSTVPVDNSDLYKPVISKYNGGSAYREAVSQLVEIILAKYYPKTSDTLLLPSDNKPTKLGEIK